MKINSILFLLILTAGLLVTKFSYCQSDTLQPLPVDKNSLGPDIGFNSFHIKDDYLSPVTFRGTFISFGIAYQHNAQKSRQMLDAGYSQGQISTDVQERETAQKTGFISYSYLRLFHSARWFNHLLEMFLGGGISSIASNTDFNATDKIYSYTFYDQSWYWAHSLTADFRAEYGFTGRNKLCGQLSLPLFSLVSRPENGHYFNQDNMDVINDFLNAAKGGSANFVWQNPVVRCKVEYQCFIDAHANFRAGYRFEYISHSEPQSMKIYSNTFFVGIGWLF